MKHYITRFIHYRDNDNEKLKITDAYDSLEEAGSVLSDILKTKLSQNWEINAFSNEDIAELGGNIITMVQGENSSKILSAIWAVHPSPEPVTNDGVLFPEYAEIVEDSDNDIPEKLTDAEPSKQFEVMKFYLTGFVFTGYGDDDKVKIVEIYSSKEAAEEKLVTLIKDKQKQGWEIESLPTEEIDSSDNNLLRMVVANMPDPINAVTWTLTTDPEPISDGKVMFSDFVDVTSSAQNHEFTKNEYLEKNEDNSILSNMDTSQKIIFACGIATALGLFSFPYGYYILLKILFFGSLIYFTIEYLKNSESTGATLVTLIVLIILYNPVFLVELGSKTLWFVVNLGTIGFMYWLSGIVNNKKILTNSSSGHFIRRLNCALRFAPFFHNSNGV